MALRANGPAIRHRNRPAPAATPAGVRADPDGLRLMVSTNENAALYDKLSYNFIRDIAPVAGVMRVPLVMEINLAIPAKTVPEFIAYAKANPGKINFASGGIGTSIHLSGELFKMMTGIEMQHVPYRGNGPALTDLLGGQVSHVHDARVIYIRADKLRALAVSTAKRSEVLPDVPTIGESVPGYEASSLYGVAAPRNTPAEIVDKLNREINAALTDPAMKTRLADLGGIALAGSAAEFGKLIAEESEKWAKVIRAGNIKAQ